ncbi:MAG: response regulator, partial [Desulfuromonadales bacterium]|nr:response regulator [Desulfuromonadales bacterium]
MNHTTPKILFIDEEQHTLTSLQRLMQNEKWHCHYVSSAKEALTYLQNQAVDLLVSDINVVDMDGIKFITDIRTNYPSIVRIFLTNYAKEEMTLNALAGGYVQQIIPKPWDDQELKEIIRSALRQRKQQANYSVEFQKRMNSIPLLPMLPKSYSDIRSCITDDEIDINKMVSVISQDAAISTILLHWANSALFGQRFHVDTIKKAIIVMGTDIVENLILSESINRSIAG